MERESSLLLIALLFLLDNEELSFDGEGTLLGDELTLEDALALFETL